MQSPVCQINRIAMQFAKIAVYRGLMNVGLNTPPLSTVYRICKAAMVAADEIATDLK